MKHFLFALALAAAVLSLPTVVHAQTSVPVAPLGADESREQASLDKHIKPILAALHLSDPAKATQVHDILAAHLKALNAWHAQNDARLKLMWNDFNKARGKKDDAAADAALAKIDDVYAALKPEHQRFLAALSAILTPEQVDTVKDVLTINKVKITFSAYGQIFHGLTDEQKAFILQNLKAAREEAIDAGAMTEKSAFFKKYKIKIEAYLTAQGYDVKQSYKNFVAKQKAASAAEDSAATSQDK